MEDEVVRRRGWLTQAEFLDYLGATNLIPGPNSTELAIHIGHAHAGWAGLLVAGTCFILPASLIVTAIAWAYVRFGTLPAATGLLYGVKPVVIASCCRRSGVSVERRSSPGCWQAWRCRLDCSAPGHRGPCCAVSCSVQDR